MIVVGLLLLLAAAGKSALVPFSGWLPRAMEGPTPSSAVLYGALSVHLGAYLLLRLNPLIGESTMLAAAVVGLGLLTALYAQVVGSVQTDIKSALSFASLGQVGLIVAEIGGGHWLPFLWYVARVHLLGHACLRTLQFVRAPNFLQDHRALEMAIAQQDVRRFFAYLFLSHASLVLAGLQLHTVVSLTGALDLWVSVALALTGLGLTLRALETRLGRLALSGFQGLYDETPALAVYFLLTGLASVGFPGALGFVATELLVDGAVSAILFVGLAVVLTAAINGIAVVRVYLILFTGGRYRTAVSLTITRRERLALLTLLALIFGGGLIPQSLVLSRHTAAGTILQSRSRRALSEPAHGGLFQTAR